MTIAEIVEVLGGKKIFKRPITTTGDLVEQIREGLPASTIPLLAALLSLQRGQLSRRLSMKVRLTLDESDRTLRMAGVIALAKVILGTEDKVSNWMNTPNRILGGRRPFGRLDT